MPNNTIETLRKRIKALQQENNGWQKRYYELDAGHSRLFKDFCKLQKENEQLQARAAQYRDALIIANNYMPDIGQFCACGKCKTCGADINYAGYEHCVKCARVIIDEAISGTPADYHNPADVEALRKARNLLQRYKDHIKSYPCECKFGLDFYGNKTPFRDGEMCERCAELAAIDKAIGGKEE